MIWLTWRQFRVQALSVFGALAVIGVILAITGPDLVGQTDFTADEALYYGTLLSLYLLPAAVGVFWGVPMVTRELETGTHSLVWNQTVTRSRWLATKLGIGVLAAMTGAGLLSLAVGWWASPIDTAAAAGAANFPSRILPVTFVARGIVPIGYAAFAFVLGVTIAILLRRTVTAMAVTLVVFAAVLVAVPYLLRPYLVPATEETVTLSAENIRSVNGNDVGGPESLTVDSPAGAWVLTNETVDTNGNLVRPLPDMVRGCIPQRPSQTQGDTVGQGPTGVMQCFAQLSDFGYQQRLVYQPGSRFWPLQWLETGFFLVVTALMAWFCFRRIRRLS